MRDCPVWMDSSSGLQCERLQRAAGGAGKLADITGSRAYEVLPTSTRVRARARSHTSSGADMFGFAQRFTGSQIAKMREGRPREFQDTEVRRLRGFEPRMCPE